MPPRTVLICVLYICLARTRYSQREVSSDPKKNNVEISGPAGHAVEIECMTDEQLEQSINELLADLNLQPAK